MKKRHLTFSAPRSSAPPPPSLLGGSDPSINKVKKKKSLAPPPASASAPPPPFATKPKKRPREGAPPPQDDRPRKKSTIEKFGDAMKKPFAAKPKQPKPAAPPAPPAAAASSSYSSSAAAASSSAAGVGAASAAVGTEPAHLLLLLGLPPSLDERALQHHFSRCAPLQLSLLRDWDGGASMRGAACLALGSSRAVTLAKSAEMAIIGGKRIRVCGPGDADDGFNSSSSPAMRTQLSALLATAGAAASTGGGGIASADLAQARHVLCAFGSHASASAAVDEFCAVAKSGAVKAPSQLLLQTLLRHRRLSGGDVWRGRLNGLPLPKAEAERLRSLLERLDWSSMPAEGKLRGTMADNSFKLGLSTKEWGRNNGPYSPFAFKPGMGVWEGQSVTKRHRELWEAAGALIHAVDPSYPWTSVQFNKNFGGSPATRHRDDKDATHQVATAFGEYTGGELRVHGQEGIVDVNTRDRFVRFDGRYEHEVLPYEGRRYSVIFFALAPPFAVDGTSTEEGVACR